MQPPTVSEAPTDRVQLRRRAQRGQYDAPTIHAIVDEALICHAAVHDERGPVVLPTMHVRLGSMVYLHGSPSNHLLRSMIDAPVCLTFTIVDALVFARSAMHHSVNYRCVVAYGKGSRVEDLEEKKRALDALIERMGQGRSKEVRAPSHEELLGTLLVRIPIDEASAKIRNTGVVDDPEDLALPVWAGIIPMSMKAGAPVRDALMVPEQQASGALKDRQQRSGLPGSVLWEEQREDGFLLSTDSSRMNRERMHEWLSKDAYWALGLEREVLDACVDRTLYFGVFLGNEQVGCARVLTDYARFAYVGDVYVAREYRGKRLGKWLVEGMLKHPALATVSRWLLGTRDAHSLYERYGFQRAEAGKYLVLNR